MKRLCGWVALVVFCVLLVAFLVPSEGADIPKFNRKKDWMPQGWIDADGDCQSARTEVLIEESIIPVTLSENGCEVERGLWLCGYTGEVFLTPKKHCRSGPKFMQPCKRQSDCRTEEDPDAICIGLDVDHFDPLGHVHHAGGWRWSPEAKIAYANNSTNPMVLVAVSGSANRSKGDKPPGMCAIKGTKPCDAWVPEDPDRWCEYGKTWALVKASYPDLDATDDERQAVAHMIGTCWNKPGE